MRRRRAILVLAVSTAVLAFLAALIPPALEEARQAVSSSSTSNSTSDPAASSGASHTAQQDSHNGTALAALDELPVKGRAAKTGYERSEFGDGWATVNGCTTRNIILYRDLQDTVLKEGCTVASGVLQDPYTGKSIAFSSQQSSAVQIDHVVALSDAWQKGAQQLSSSQRAQLANDPLELLAVDGPANQAKGDGDAATWLPTNKSFRCAYVARQITVKQKYHLWVTQAEKTAMQQVLASCPDQTLIAP